MKLTNSTLKKIKKNAPLKRALMDLFDKSQYTIESYLNKNNTELCRYDSLQVISAYLECEINDLLTESTLDFKPIYQSS
ncbi:MAG: hypothetical protein H8D45_23915 [Bacteroidetes bacterium]|nr:hypothetical protein [Bacteroidota bacterium]MBL7105807.1 hypothetical protein [Bacteroidales bacterium]